MCVCVGVCVGVCRADGRVFPQVKRIREVSLKVVSTRPALRF